MTPEIPAPHQPVEQLQEYNERTFALGMAIDQDVERHIRYGKDLLESRVEPYALLELLLPLLEEAEEQINVNIQMLAEEYGRDSITLFRLRLRTMTIAEEVIWRTLEGAKESSEARSLMLWAQRQLYGHYVQAIDQIFTTNDVRITGADRRGALQEVTVLALLSKEPHPYAAIFVSSPLDDKAKIDLKLYYHQNDRSLVQNIQVKTQVLPKEQDLGYAHTVIVNGFDTGNLECEEDGRVIRSWRTAYAMWRQVHAAKDPIQDEKDKSHIKELLKYNSHRSVIGSLNDLGKR